MHKLLKRQITKSISPNGNIDYDKLLDLVSLAYNEQEQHNKLAERATQLMSDEMSQQNRELKAHRENLEELSKNVP